MINKSQKEKADKFINMYSSGQIIYPAAVQRYVRCNNTDTKNLLNERSEKIHDIKAVYILKCPICSRMTHGMYYDSNSLNTCVESACTECDSIFILRQEDYIKCYKKI